ncbi:MAG: hypothetical protein A4E24_01764 [Methanomethylovorans sp. PtaU1.Bin093]|nr:MAG: hypothetical protein A4E24_01764 [Methanomethylovorans sp. PtaU1.Bin093]
MQDDKSYLISGKHLRLTLQIEKNETTIQDMNLINESLVEPEHVVGPFIMNIVFGNGPVWVDTMQDPFVHRGIPRRGEHEHHYEIKDSATVVARVPIPSKSMPDDFHIDFYRARGPLPEEVHELESLLCSKKSNVLEHLSTVNLPTLKKHPEWGSIMQQAGFNPRDSI